MSIHQRRRRAPNASSSVDLALRKVHLRGAPCPSLWRASRGRRLALIAALSRPAPRARQTIYDSSRRERRVCPAVPRRSHRARTGRRPVVRRGKPRRSDEGADARSHVDAALAQGARGRCHRLGKNAWRWRAAGPTAAARAHSFGQLEKGVLRHVSVQHLLRGLLRVVRRGRSEADVLAALHPTPAVCGHPRQTSLDASRRCRGNPSTGVYAPARYLGRRLSAEFAVAIRIDAGQTGRRRRLAVRRRRRQAAADSAAEWRELNLKTRPLEALLAEGRRSYGR